MIPPSGFIACPRPTIDCLAQDLTPPIALRIQALAGGMIERSGALLVNVHFYTGGISFAVSLLYGSDKKWVDATLFYLFPLLSFALLRESGKIIRLTAELLL